MKKSLLVIAILMASVTGFAQRQLATRPVIPENFDPMNVQQQFDSQMLLDIAKQEGATKRTKRPAYKPALKQMKKADAQTYTFFTVAQSFHKSYSFNYDGGDIYTYETTLTIDGTKATFSNLFNAAASSTDWSTYEEYNIEGVYNAAAKTITIAAPTSIDEATIVADLMGYYDGVISAGTINTSGQMQPDAQLVFDIEGDFDRITTNQHFGLAEWNRAHSMSYGMWRVFRSFSMQKPTQTAKVVTFNNSLSFGELFPTSQITKTLTVVNTGTDETDYAITIEADDDAFTTTTANGTIAGQSTAELSFTMACSQLGEKEGLATLTYDADGAQPVMIQLAGEIIPMPDYSPIVKSGDFVMETEIDFPFELVTLDDGTQVAQSGTHGAYGNSSLIVKFNVPAGHIGNFSWKGYSNNSSQWYQSAAYIYVDGVEVNPWNGYNSTDQDISGTQELSPGEHNVTFQYQGKYYTGLEENRMYVYDLELTNVESEEDNAELQTPNLNLGNFILGDEENKTGEAKIILLNRGTNDLQITDATSDNADFVVDINNLTAPKTMETVEIPVYFNVNSIGNQTANLSVTTSAGTFNVKATARVIEMPDFSAIITEGAEYFTQVTTSSDHPFIVEGNKTYNMESGEPDDEYSAARLSFYFTVPEGKLGYISWDARSYGSPEDEEGYWGHEYSIIEMVKINGNSGTHAFWGNDVDASSASMESDEVWGSYLACVPGDYIYSFGYQKNGDGIVPEGDRIEISNMRLHVIDFDDYNAELLNDEVYFEPTTVGPQRYTTATVTLRNIGLQNLEVIDIPSAEPFYGIVPTENAAFNKVVNVTLWFYPTETGEFDKDLTIKTTAGDFIVHCHGTALSSDGVLLNGDFEDNAYGWVVYDRNLDGETWNLGTNLWGERPTYVHSGIQCLASISFSNDLGSITPDNWTISPGVDIPADGAKLSYYVAGFHPDRYAEHYSLYIVEDASDVNDILANETPVIEEDITEVPDQDEAGNVLGWQYNEVDLAPYAGKTIFLVYRHHGCTGQYILRLDDVMIVDNTYDAISDVNADSDAKAVSMEIYNASGVRTATLSDGINIVRQRFADGSVKTKKVVK